MKTKWCFIWVPMLILCAGVRLQAQQTDTNSIQTVKIKAENGEARSQTILGVVYEFGLRGTTKDDGAAIKWYRKAAEQDFAPAQYELGVCFANGLGLEKNQAEAMKWYFKAANQNLAVAQYNLGVCYRDGQGVAKDEEEGAIWFRKAADQNLAVAQYNLGVCYSNGQGVTKDDLKAVKWYRQAADQNLAYAQCNLGAYYEHGRGVAEDHVEAVKLYRKAADQNYALAQYNLAVCYANGQGVPHDAMEAVKWYRLAAEQNNAPAQCNLGICYANGQGVEQDASEAVKWFLKAANQNDPEAQYNLGVYYYYGTGVAQNDTEAYFWFSLSATQGVADASRSRNIIASRFSQEQIAEAMKRIISFVPLKANTEQTALDSIISSTFLNQLAYPPKPELIGQNSIAPSERNESVQKTETAAPQKSTPNDYFTIGSTKEDVLAIQGEPTTFNDNYLSYGMSMVTFQDGKVINWNNMDVKLKAKYLTATNLVPKEYFTVGSTRDEVLAIEGEPTTFSDNYLSYGMSMVTFQDGKVINWNSADVKLKAKYLIATNLIPKGYFTVGSTRDEVLAIEGEPTTFSDTYLTYGMSMVMFKSGKVVNWNNSDIKLKAKYLTATNLIPNAFFTVGSTRDEVLAIEGEPTTFSDTYLTYGMSMVMFQDGKVANWNNMDVKLKARYTPTSNSQLEQNLQDEITNSVPDQISVKPNEPPVSVQNSQRFNPSPVHAPDPRLTKEDITYLRSQGIDPSTVTVQDTPQQQVHGIAFMDSFFGTTNFCVPSDNVISMKTDALQFQINGKTYDYSGHYAVMLTTPRKHRNPDFGFGTPDKAKLIIIDDFGGDTMPLPDATVWEKSSGFIDVEALGKEWIYSGTYTIQN